MGEAATLHTTDLRTQILDAARHLMVTDGYDSISMRKIATYIGYSATSIYLHFKSKGDLFHTLIDEGMDKLYDVLNQTAISASALSPRQELEAVCASFVEFGLSNREYYEVMFVLHPDTGRRYPPEKYRKARRNIKVIESALERGLHDGSVEVEDTYLAANSIWAMLHGVVTLLIARRVDNSISQEQLTSSVISTVLTGIEGDSGSQTMS